MSILHEFENMKYRFVLDLISKEEQYDKKNGVITAREAFELCYNRYLLMQQVLQPLKNKLGKCVDITDISYTNGMQDDIGIIVKYLKDGKQYLLGISNIDFEDINVISSDSVVQSDEFISNNRDLILETFRNIINNNLEYEIVIPSTTRKCIIKDDCDKFTIKDSEGKIFSIEKKYSSYEKTGSLASPLNLECNYPKLKDLLLEENNTLALYNHLYIYEDDFPKELVYR